jgi:hypothetical protein
MRTGNNARYERWDDGDYGMENIIYLDDHRDQIVCEELHDYRKSLRRMRKPDRADTFWNVLFIAACLSVVVVLFLH